MRWLTIAIFLISSIASAQHPIESLAINPPDGVLLGLDFMDGGYRRWESSGGYASVSNSPDLGLQKSLPSLRVDKTQFVWMPEFRAQSRTNSYYISTWIYMGQNITALNENKRIYGQKRDNMTIAWGDTSELMTPFANNPRLSNWQGTSVDWDKTENTNRWVHFLMSVVPNGAPSDGLFLYKNGVLFSSDTTAGSISTDTASAFLYGHHASEHEIAGRDDWGWVGYLGEIVFVDGPITVDGIQNIYQRGKALRRGL